MLHLACKYDADQVAKEAIWFGQVVCSNTLSVVAFLFFVSHTFYTLFLVTLRSSCDYAVLPRFVSANSDYPAYLLGGYPKPKL